MKDYLLIFVSALFGAFITWLFGILHEARKDKKSTNRKLEFLLAELQENKLVIETPHMAGGLAFARLRADAWESVKGETQSLSCSLSSNLRTVFMKVSKYNEMVEQLHAKGEGRMKGAMEVYRGEIDPLLDACITELKTHLANS